MDIKDFYVCVHVPVFCPKHDFNRFASNCLASRVLCLKRCPPILALLGDVPLRQACQWAHEERSREQRLRKQQSQEQQLQEQQRREKEEDRP